MDPSVRRVALTSFALQAIRSRLLCARDTEPGALAFTRRAGTPHRTNNVCRLLRDGMDAAETETVTPLRFRRTVVDDAQGVLLASEVFGHCDPHITMQHYIQRNKTVDPCAAEYLERVFRRAG